MKTGCLLAAIYIIMGVAAILGEVQCILKFCKCDFEPSYKAEVIYGVGTFTGLGAIVGYMDLGE